MKAKGRVVDARNKIIQKKRSTVLDARDVLASMAKKQDARSKILKMREHKKGEDIINTNVRAIGSSILRKTDRNGKISLVTNKSKAKAKDLNQAVREHIGLSHPIRGSPSQPPIRKTPMKPQQPPQIQKSLVSKTVSSPPPIIRKTILNDVDYAQKSVRSQSTYTSGSADPYRWYRPEMHVNAYPALPPINPRLGMRDDRCSMSPIDDVRIYPSDIRYGIFFKIGVFVFTEIMFAVSNGRRRLIWIWMYVTMKTCPWPCLWGVTGSLVSILVWIATCLGCQKAMGSWVRRKLKLLCLLGIGLLFRICSPLSPKTTYGWVFFHFFYWLSWFPTSSRWWLAKIIVCIILNEWKFSWFQELFEDIGQLLVARLVRPGTGEVIYKNLKDAQKAVDTYHNRQLDGQPMKCMLVNKRPLNNPTAPALISKSNSDG